MTDKLLSLTPTILASQLGDEIFRKAKKLSSTLAEIGP